jgi:hypothetical protein
MVTMAYAVLADLVAAVHAAFLVFLVVGGLLAWRWRRLIVAHVASGAWAVAIVAIGFSCPLTPLEKHLRGAGGEPVYDGPFIAHYIAGSLYPVEHETLVRLLVAVVVLVSWAGWLTGRGTLGHRPSPHPHRAARTAVHSRRRAR